MKASFWRRFSLVFVGILVVAAVFCWVVEWETTPEYGLALIYGGVLAIFLGAILTTPTPTKSSWQGTSGSHYAEHHLAVEDLHEDVIRQVRNPVRGVFGWLAGGLAAILVGVLMRVLCSST